MSVGLSKNISVMREIVDGYRDANIPLEGVWNDIDIYQLYRDFTNVRQTVTVTSEITC